MAFIPYRANSSTRRGGTASSPADPTPNPMISATRSSAATNALPDWAVGPRRNRSRSDTRAPSATSSSLTSPPASSAFTSPATVSHNRCSAASVTRATSRVSVVTPGSRTRRSRSQPTAPSKIAFGPSPVVHARSSTH